MNEIIQNIGNFLKDTGVAQLFETIGGWKVLIMYAIVFVLFYLAIVKKFEPMLLLPIAFGMLLTNLPGTGMYHSEFFFDDFYVGFQDGKATGLFAADMQAFLDAISARFGANAYTIVEGIVKFDPAIIGEDFSALFNEYVGDFAKIKESENGALIQIKMSTILKQILNEGGLLDFLYIGVKLGIYPSLIFLGIGAPTL